MKIKNNYYMRKGWKEVTQTLEDIVLYLIYKI